MAGRYVTAAFSLCAAALDAASRSETLVSPAWVRSMQSDSGAALVVVETSWESGGPPEKYLQGHIPGAVHLDT
ncbi:MAG: hypothetical protein ACRD96_19950, partial [Bryobacteraceae bacterium]